MAWSIDIGSQCHWPSTIINVCISLNIESAIYAFFHVLYIYFRKATGCVLSLQRTNWKISTNISQISLRYVLNPCHASDDATYIFIYYNKTCVKWPLKNRQYKDLNNNWKLNEGRKYCRMLHLQHSTILLTCIQQ